MDILIFPTPYLRSSMYLLCENGRGILIDPYGGEEYTAQIMETVKIMDYIILTHEHFDHISGTDIMRRRYQARVLCSDACAGRIRDPKANASRYFSMYASIQEGEAVLEKMLEVSDYTTYADESFSGTKELLWEGHRLELKQTPGHSPGSICILVDDTALFTGDSLLEDDKLMTRFPGGSTKVWIRETLPVLCGYPQKAVVYPGHYHPFVLEDRMRKAESEYGTDLWVHGK